MMDYILQWECLPQLCYFNCLPRMVHFVSFICTIMFAISQPTICRGLWLHWVCVVAVDCFALSSRRIRVSMDVQMVTVLNGYSFDWWVDGGNCIYSCVRDVFIVYHHLYDGQYRRSITAYIQSMRVINYTWPEPYLSTYCKQSQKIELCRVKYSV